VATSVKKTMRGHFCHFTQQKIENEKKHNLNCEIILLW
jgi:hypothetical protein